MLSNPMLSSSLCLCETDRNMAKISRKLLELRCLNLRDLDGAVASVRPLWSRHPRNLHNETWIYSFPQKLASVLSGTS